MSMKPDVFEPVSQEEMRIPGDQITEDISKAPVVHEIFSQWEASDLVALAVVRRRLNSFRPDYADDATTTKIILSDLELPFSV